MKAIVYNPGPRPKKAGSRTLTAKKGRKIIKKKPSKIKARKPTTRRKPAPARRPALAPRILGLLKALKREYEAGARAVDVSLTAADYTAIKKSLGAK